MNLFETILLNIVFIIFPLIFCLLYESYNKALDKEKNDLFLDCALFSSFYLIVRFGTTVYGNNPLIFFHIPLIVTYVKNRRETSILLSVAMILYYYHYLNIPVTLLLLEYIIYYGIYWMSKKNNWQKSKMIDIQLISKCFILTLFVFSFMNPSLTFPAVFGYAIACFSFCIITKFTIYLFERAEEILSLHHKIKDFEQQKQVQESLFKITHEIKNPIAVCKGYLDMFDVNNPEHGRKYIPILKEETERVLYLLEDFLSINKIQIKKDIMDINYLVENIKNNFMPIIEDRQIETKFRTNDDELFIYGDYNRISQVLINIIKNALESIPLERKGQLKVSVIEQKSQIKIVITDNGIGMNKEEIKKIKTPFFTTKQKGTGLGVYLSNEIITCHEGKIDYISKENLGTTVMIKLPKSEKEMKKNIKGKIS